MGKSRTSLGATMFALGALFASPAFAVGGVVGTGSAASCTETAFDTVLGNAQSSGGGVITFNCGVAPVAIVLTNYKTISSKIEVRGAGLVTLSGGNSSAIFQVFNTGNLTLRGLVVARGYGPQGAIENFGAFTMSDGRLDNNTSTGSGGALTNHGNAALTNVMLDGNSAGFDGGAIYSDGAIVNLSHVQLTNNVAGRWGGAISTEAGGTLTLDLVRVARNRAADGGGIRTASTLSIYNATFARNSATTGSGGGLFFLAATALVQRTVFVANSAVTSGGALHQASGSVEMQDVNIISNGGVDGENGPLNGGGIGHLAGTLDLRSVGLLGNRAVKGAAVSHAGGTGAWTNVTVFGNNSTTPNAAVDFTGGTVTVTNATFALNSDHAINRTAGTFTVRNSAFASNNGNCVQPLVASTFSLADDATCGLGGARDNVPLEFKLDQFFNGGFTATIRPAPGNPMIDGGSNALCPLVDQTGAPRPAGLACDIGALEVVPGAPQKATAFEYYHADFGHYFITVGVDEIVMLDEGSFAGWARTGESFAVNAKTGATLIPAAKAANDLVPVCRFFTTAFPPKSSHFYAPAGLGCEGTKQNKDWEYEGDVFYTQLPSPAGACPAGSVPIYRLFNNGQGGAPNHRFTTSLDVRAQMIGQGFLPEGAGIGVGMCSPL